MTEPQNNGHDPFASAHNAPEVPQAHPQAQMQAKDARNAALRRQVAAAEDETDHINALLITEQVRSMTLAAENSQLKARLSEFEDAEPKTESATQES